MTYNWLVREDDDVPRNLTAWTLGIIAGVVGDGMPLVSLAVGVAFEALRPAEMQGTTMEHITDGVVDGSLALLGRAIGRSWSGAEAYGLALPLVDDDDGDALVG